MTTHQTPTPYGPIAADRLQACAQRFLMDLETSMYHGTCDETPAHKVWHVVRGEDARWPVYEWGTQDKDPCSVLIARWDLDGAEVDAYWEERYGDCGPPVAYSPTAWADFLQMPLAVYEQLRDFVLQGQVDRLWALADTGTLTPPTSARDQSHMVLAAARLLPPTEQLYVIHRLTDTLQYHLGAVAEDDAQRRPGAPRLPQPHTYGSDR